jgi:hypothetical protein
MQTYRRRPRVATASQQANAELIKALVNHRLDRGKTPGLEPCGRLQAK